MKKRIGYDCYYVDLYEIGSKRYPWEDFGREYEIECVGKVLVYAKKNGGTKSNKSIGNCFEAIEGFKIPVFDARKGHYRDDYDNTDWDTTHIPYGFDEHEGKKYFVFASALKQDAFATPDEVSNYNPENERWYKAMKQTKVVEEKKKVLLAVR